MKSITLIMFYLPLICHFAVCILTFGLPFSGSCRHAHNGLWNSNAAYAGARGREGSHDERSIKANLLSSNYLGSLYF